MGSNERHDHVDSILADWARERPDVDVSPMAILARVSRLARFVEKDIDATLSEYGVSQRTFNVLAALRRAGPTYTRSPSDLQSSILISSGTMTSRLDRLEAIGLVARERNPDDRRGIHVRLTDSGIELMDELLRAHMKNEATMLAGLSRFEKATVANILRKLLIHFERDHGGARAQAESQFLDIE